MASSGSISLTLQSVDYYGCPMVCYPNTTGRGAVSYSPSFNWYLNDSNQLSFTFTGGSSYWYVCSVTDNFYLKVQFSTDGSSWSDLGVSQLWHSTCSQSYTVQHLISDLTSLLPTMTLSQSGYVRIYTYTGSACPYDCGSDDRFPNAYPTEAASQAVAVAVHIDVDWTATLKYNANGGTGAPSNQTHTQTGNSHTFTVSNTVPTRTNYRFEGWATSSSASTPAYHGGDSYTINKSDPTKTLYAVWTEFYRPGATFVSADPNQWGTQSGEWYTHNRGDKAAHIMGTEGGSSWTEMRTIDAPTGLGDPPAIYHDSKWYNQKKIGKS